MRIRLVRSLAPALLLAALPLASFAGVSVGVSINIAPPALPIYVQPAPPAADYIWTPGYWAWGEGDYYWVPGTWVLAPEPGMLWTPGYWGWDSGAYLWHGGYWGPHVGFYGGVNYGFGYGGSGYQGGYWRGGHVVYNRSVTNVTNINVTNVYNKRVVVNNVNRVSFNGGHGGLTARANATQLAAEHDRHVDFTPAQRQHVEMAAGNRDLRASVNGGRPRIAATARPDSFSGKGVVAARAAGGPVRTGSEHGSNEIRSTRADRPPNAGGQHPQIAAGAARPGGNGGGAAGAVGRPAGGGNPVAHERGNVRPSGGGNPTPPHVGGGRREGAAAHAAPRPEGGGARQGGGHPEGGAARPQGGGRPQGGARPEGGGRPEGGNQGHGPEGGGEHR